LAESGTALDRQLAEQLGAAFSRSAVLLASPGQPTSDQLALRPALLELLEAANTSVPERRVLLLMAADRLADRLLVTERQSSDWDEQRQHLGTYGLTFQWNELGGAWQYTHDLLWQIWKESGDTAWGDQAFVLLLSHGWDTRVGCENGSDQFRAVILNGEQSLRERPRSPNRAQVLLFLAQSYETWWSLSRASDRDDYVDPHKYQDGADAARQKAVNYYETVLRLPDTSDQAASARLALPRLKLGIDTHQRRFYCIYD